MKLFPECVPCVLNQGIRTIKKVTTDPEKRWDLLRLIYDEMGERWHKGMSPIELSIIVNNIIVKYSNENDPYRKDKDLQNKHALDYYEGIKADVLNAENSLLEGIKYAICGNKIDLGIFADIDVKKTIEMCDDININNSDVNEFERVLDDKSPILYLTDNAGEIVFDKILIDILSARGKDVYVGVRNMPIINDVTVREAEMLGFPKDKILPVKIGDFDLIKRYPLVISKGQANFETYHMLDNIYFLFMIKCQILAKALNKPIYSIFFAKYGDEI